MSPRRIGAPHHSAATTGPQLGCLRGRGKPTTPLEDFCGRPGGRGTGGGEDDPLGPLLRAALRSALCSTAVVLVLAAVTPRRPEPAPVVVPPFGGYVAICCARPVVIQELRR